MKSARNTPQSFWAVRLECPYIQCEVFETALADIALAVSSYEVEEHAKPEAIWGVEGLFTEQPDAGLIATRIALAAKAHNLSEPKFRIEHVPARDWLKESYASFAPIRAGQFYIYGDHIETPESTRFPAVLESAVRIRLPWNAGSGAAKVSSPGRGYARGSSSVRRPPCLPPPR